MGTNTNTIHSPASKVQNTYSVRQIDPIEFRDAALAIMGSDNKSLDETVFDWFYRDNPYQDLQLYALFCRTEAGEKMVGWKTIMPRQWLFEGKLYSFGNMCGLKVDQKHRSLGPALTLLRYSLEHAKQSTDFCYGFPNKSAQPLFKRIGSKPIGEFARYAKPLKTKDFIAADHRLSKFAFAAKAIDTFLQLETLILRALSGRLLVTETATPDDSFDELWKNANKENWVIGERSSRFLRWRACAYPLGVCHIVTFKHSNTSPLFGYVSFVINPDGIIHINDFLCLEGTAGIKKLLLNFLVYIRKFCAKGVSIGFFGDQDVINTLSGLRFSKRDQRPIFTADGRSLTHAEVGDREWYVTAVDEDQ